ncbi:hypothetical protein J7E96_01925 [Streptomyces sp. ISL-96]|uniref:hypothetical protein n=1 Tax=Streptomyces sp. ISL-96 TaxID=2819191 RepID=UPI001BE74CA3|nr:hypothetical protein [Streptomyces sp. ISL-96]MBT2487316.1 hypothetical protein [Streptomyces sp. ISL-96]
MVGLTVLIPVLMPVLMLGVIIALGRYEEFILPTESPAELPAKARGNRHRRTR